MLLFFVSIYHQFSTDYYRITSSLNYDGRVYAIKVKTKGNDAWKKDCKQFSTYLVRLTLQLQQQVAWPIWFLFSFDIVFIFSMKFVRHVFLSRLYCALIFCNFFSGFIADARKKNTEWNRFQFVNARDLKKSVNRVFAGLSKIGMTVHRQYMKYIYMKWCQYQIAYTL